jgi:hypothetical protein
MDLPRLRKFYQLGTISVAPSWPADVCIFLERNWDCGVYRCFDSTDSPAGVRVFWFVRLRPAAACSPRPSTVPLSTRRRSQITHESAPGGRRLRKAQIRATAARPGVPSCRNCSQPAAPLAGLANTDDIHKSDASEEQECNGDLIEHVWHQDKSRCIANQLGTVLATGTRYCKLRLFLTMDWPGCSPQTRGSIIYQPCQKRSNPRTAGRQRTQTR